MKDIILTHKYERDQLLQGDWIPRENLASARKHLENNLIKAIIGPRRAGKSVFCIQLLSEKDFAYINFDDERLVSCKDYDDIIKAMISVYGKTRYIVLDEIQNLPRWELFVNRMQRQGFNIVLTGSNSHLLSSELASHLTGRHIAFSIFPFSFKEYLQAKKVQTQQKPTKTEQGEILHHLSQYLVSGGFPEIVVKQIHAQDYLKMLVESVIFKDVVKRHNVRFSKLLFDLTTYLLGNHSHETTYSRIKNALGFRSVHTVQNYIAYLQESYLVFLVQRYSYKSKERIKAPFKIFGYDNGVIDTITFKTSPDSGKLLENLAAIQLIRKDVEFYYARDQENHEIDFVIKSGPAVRQLIQVSYNIETPKTRDRELCALAKGSGKYSCNDLLLLTWDSEGTELFKSKTIKILPAWKWLLQ